MLTEVGVVEIAVGLPVLPTAVSSVFSVDEVGLAAVVTELIIAIRVEVDL